VKHLRQPLQTTCHTCRVARLDVSVLVLVAPVDVDEVDDNCEGVQLSAFAQPSLGSQHTNHNLNVIWKSILLFCHDLRNNLLEVAEGVLCNNKLIARKFMLIW
jgi:hypothetical protein